MTAQLPARAEDFYAVHASYLRTYDVNAWLGKKTLGTKLKQCMAWQGKNVKRKNVLIFNLVNGGKENARNNMSVSVEQTRV